MISVLQWFYIIVGLVMCFAGSLLIIRYCLESIYENYEKIRQPYQYWHWQRILKDIANTNQTYNPSISFVANKLANCFQNNYTGIDVWKLRDEIEDKFGRGNSPELTKAQAQGKGEK